MTTGKALYGKPHAGKTILLAIACGAIFVGSAVETVSIPSLPAPGLIDGDLSDASWGKAFATGAFKSADPHEALTESTEGWIFCDSENLYVAAKMRFADYAAHEKLLSANEERYTGDSVEVFIDPGDTGSYAQLGVTEAGTERMALIKSSIGIGSLLAKGIGDTIRVSMTADPVREVGAGFDILKALGLKNDCARIVSCPTCGRTKIDLISLAREVESRLEGCKKPVTVAVMGCAVNGPGEARQADIGIAGGDGCALIFKKGEILRKVPENRAVDELIKEIETLEI